VNTCIGSGNHIHFVLYLPMMAMVLGLHAFLCVVLLLDPSLRTARNLLLTVPIMLHSVLMVVYCVLLFTQQYGVVFEALTINERMVGWRYKYMTVDRTPGSHGHGGQKMVTPFNEGFTRNCLNFFKLRTPKRVVPTLEMAGEGSAAAQHLSPAQAAAAAAASGGAMLPPAKHSWEGLEFLLQGVLVTPGSEMYVAQALDLKQTLDKLNDPSTRLKVQADLHAQARWQHGARTAAMAGGQHGHSHGGQPCHGHGGAASDNAHGHSH